MKQDVICGPVAGGCEDHKHKDPFEAAQHELEEEVGRLLVFFVREDFGDTCANLANPPIH